MGNVPTRLRISRQYLSDEISVEYISGVIFGFFSFCTVVLNIEDIIKKQSRK